MVVDENVGSSEFGSKFASGASRVVGEQRRFFDAGSTRKLGFRSDSLRALAAELEKRTDASLAALAADLGKPALEGWLSELHFLRLEIKLALRGLSGWAKPQRVRNPFYFLPARSEIRREPFGVVLIASPWNYPLQLALSPLISAVAAGNCAVLKPSELAPASSAFLAEIVAAVFDPGHVAVVEGDAETGAVLLDHPFDLFFYTGGEKVGRLYAEAAARNLAPAVLELGGKCPCVVDSEVDLDRTVERIVANKFFNAGQTCVAPDFVLVPASRRDEFVAKAVAETERLYGGGCKPDLARIVNRRHYERLQSLLGKGAIRIGDDDVAGLLFAPRILPDADWDSPSMGEEIFGPILPVLAYEEMESALESVATLPSPLAVYAFSRRRATLEHIATSSRSGAVCFNDVMKPAANPRLPLGGVGRSGMGRYRGRSGYDSFTYQRSVTRRWLLRDPFQVKPPYGDRLKRLRKLLGG